MNSEERRVPSLKKIIWTDYWSMLMFIVPLVFLVFLVFSTVFVYLPEAIQNLFEDMQEDSAFFQTFSAYGTLGTLLFFYPLLLWRSDSIKNIFRTGIEVKGIITDISFSKDRGRVEYEYIVDGKTFNKGNALHKNSGTEVLKKGSEMILLVDKENHEKAFLRDIYL